MKITATPLRNLLDRSYRASVAIEEYLDDLDLAGNTKTRRLAAELENPSNLYADLEAVRLRFNKSGFVLGREGEEGAMNAALYLLGMANAESLGFEPFGLHQRETAHDYLLFAAHVLSRADPARLPAMLRSAETEAREFETVDDNGDPAEYQIPSAKYLRINVGRARRRLSKEFACTMRLLLHRGGSIESWELIGTDNSNENATSLAARPRQNERITERQINAVRQIVKAQPMITREALLAQLRMINMGMRTQTLREILTGLKKEGLSVPLRD